MTHVSQCKTPNNWSRGSALSTTGTPGFLSAAANAEIAALSNEYMRFFSGEGAPKVSHSGELHHRRHHHHSAAKPAAKPGSAAAAAPAKAAAKTAKSDDAAEE